MSQPQSRVIALIPARLAATRLPNKPLVAIAGKPMIQHVWERVRQAAGVDVVAVATPDAEIMRAVEGFGGQALLTLPSHRSGTDRLAEAAILLQLQPDDIVINIQGDEPLIDPAAILRAFTPLRDEPNLPMASLMCPCPPEDWENPACVKVVCAQNGNALYFSRARLPFTRNAESGGETMQHVGLYAYRRSFLATFAELAPTPLELTESLEQLRVLENGYQIRMTRIENAPIGVDTPEDLERVRHLLSQN